MSGSKTNSLAMLQLYFPSASRARVTRFWHRLSPPALAQQLLRAATAANIEQDRLRAFLSEHFEELRKVRAVLMLCELPITAGAIPDAGPRVGNENFHRITL
ncbi:hypothetical protein [Pseudomonas carassii]|uniref:Uncharacterized protein n=1 Tax=Pseudomonas carassii TaxID=3115855 RepID=A0ABU7H621_9PSED|nr:hypothetical protein [Pseudomonas sp. 137P]MEE1886585.1 hypothetical protein [Pseudomonas sp. 137P]